jgi:YD repeat-containing protein
LCPTCTVYSVATGTSSNFDVLGRLVGTSQSSELGDLGTTVTYAASGFSKTVRNARGKATTTHYRAYDEPVETWPIRIEMPESVVFDIDRDAFDAPRSITRSGSRLSNGVLLPVSATRSYVYDTQHQLCKTIEPEVGATVMGYDGAGNVSWTATGLNLPSGTQCDHGAPSVAAVRSDRTYDAVNRPLDTTFADGSPSIRRTYWPDGQLKTLRTSGTNPADTTQWSYEYNARRLLTSETLSMDGTSYALTNRYDGNGYLKTLVYPDLVEVDYAPDALGQQTRAGNSIKAYASNVARWPNGAISGFTYGNGIVRSLEQNARGLPKRSHDAGVIDDTYAFDENANVSSIADAIAGTARTMQYDDLDRLESALAGSPWGNASYVYDAIDNGWFQGAIADAAYQFERKINSGDRVVVGVNRFTEGNEDDNLDILQITHEQEQQQIKRLQAVRADRDSDEVARGLEHVQRDAEDPERNLMPALIDAVQAYATEGEIMNALAEVFGRYVEKPVL